MKYVGLLLILTVPVLTALGNLRPPVELEPINLPSNGPIDLGGTDLDRYCGSLSEGSKSAYVDGIWCCKHDEQEINFEEVCKKQYPDGNEVYADNPTKSQFGWRCFEK